MVFRVFEKIPLTLVWKVDHKEGDGGTRLVAGGQGENSGRGQASDDGDLDLAMTAGMGKSTPMSNRDGK